MRFLRCGQLRRNHSFGLKAGEPNHEAEPDIVREGEGRNTFLTSPAGKLRRAGCSEATILAALTQHNREHCKPPLPLREVRSIAYSIGRKEVGEEPSTAYVDAPLRNNFFLIISNFSFRLKAGGPFGRVDIGLVTNFDVDIPGNGQPNVDIFLSNDSNDVGALKKLAHFLCREKPLDYDGVRRAVADRQSYAGWSISTSCWLA